MRWMEKLRMRLQMLLHRGRETGRLDQELQFHIDQQIAENIGAGMSAAEARYAALRSFGNPAALREQAREAWSWNALTGWLSDIRIGSRTLLRAPGFAFMTILVMALCLGATTSLFTIVRAVLLRPLPFPDSDKLVMVYEHFRSAGSSVGFNYNVVSPGDYYDWRAQTHGFEDMAAWRNWQFNLSGDKDDMPEKIAAGAGTFNLFSVLQVHPVLGRTFTPAEDHPGAAHVAILSWSLFERRFGANPSAVGTQIRLDATPYTIVGVLPRWFTYPEANVQLWVPYASVVTPELLARHDFHQSYVVARLRSGVSLADAMSQVEAVQNREHLQHLDAPVAEDAVARPILADVVTDVRTPLLILLCAVGCMLLIGCLNIANLLVARGAARQKEVAIRAAIGASRLTLIRQQLVESMLICIAGGIIGVLLSVGATHWLVHAWADLPRVDSIHADWTVILFAAGLVLLAALVAGLVPALSSTRKNSFAVLQDSSRAVQGSHGRASLRRTLLTVEIAVTVVLLISAGLLFKSFIRLRTTDVGATTRNVLTMHYSLPSRKYQTPAKNVAFNEELLNRVRQLPGVRAAGLGYVVPGAGYGGDDIFTIPEHPSVTNSKDLPDAMSRMADPDYFTALQIPLLQGRFFTAQDRLDRSHYIIISHQLAQRYFPHENPIGKHMRTAWQAGKEETYEIVGVVGDTLYRAGKPSQPTMYIPAFMGLLDRDYTLVVRTAGNPLSLSVPVQRVIASLDRDLPVSDVLTMDQIIGQSAGTTSFSASLVLAFASLSLLLAAVGLFGVLSYIVAQRTSEIGIRIALGARREEIVRLMMGDGLRPALYGLVLGLAASAAVTRLIVSMLYGTAPMDPVVFAGVSAALLAVAVVACAVPAWRASRLDPMQALRTE
jgi:predicted permease